MFFVHTSYRQPFHMLYGQTFIYIQHIDKLSICCMRKSVRPYNIWKSCVYIVWTSCLFICLIDKDISDYMEQVHNEYIDMNYSRKIYMNTAPTVHNISFTERQNFSYSVLLGLIPPWNIAGTTQCSGSSSSSVFIKSQKSDNLHRNNDSP